MTDADLLGMLTPSIYAPTYIRGDYKGWRAVADRLRVPRRLLGERPIIGNWFYRLEEVATGKVSLICSFETYYTVKKKAEKQSE